MSRSPVLIMAGGTGGHVFPALAVAQRLMALNYPVIWLGTGRGLENRVVPAEGISLERIRVAGLRRKGLLSWLLAPFKIVIAVMDAFFIVQRLRPGVVLGMGGFASGPGGFAAWMLRRPLVIHEQNAAAGLTNRLLAGLAREVLQAFPGSFSGRTDVHTIGNPVRPEMFGLKEPAERLAGRKGPLRILVLGGSQGALALNETVPAALAQLDAALEVDVWHQTGPATQKRAVNAYAEHELKVRLDSFIEDMNEAYEWADMVICRSGALTVSEIAAAGLGAVLVPYPSSVDDHQTLNALYLVNADAAVLIQQTDLSPERLAEEISRCAANRKLVLDRAVNARKLASPNATEDLVNACLGQMQEQAA